MLRLAGVVGVVAGVATLGMGTARAALSPGQMDPAFGSGGYTVVEPSLAVPRSSSASSLAVDGLGRLVVGGAASDANGKPSAWAGRLGANGAPDASFGDGWRGVFQLGSGGTGAFRPYSFTNEVFVASNGKIGLVPYRIFGGVGDGDGRNSGAQLLRLTDAGQRDPEHGTSGLGGPATPNAPVNMLASTGIGNADGSAFLGGSFDADENANGGRTAAWWKLDAFGTSVVIPGSGSPATLQASRASAAADQYSSISDMIRLPDGKTLIAGSTTWTDTRGAGFVARLLPSGQLDTSFSGTGPGFTVVQSRDPAGPAGGDSTISSIAVGPDGLIYAAGYADDGNGVQAFSVTRLGPGGIVDTSFGSQGTRRLQLAGGTSEYRRSSVQTVLVQPDGKPLLVGAVDETGTGNAAAVVRLLPSGLLDPSFGAGGIQRVPAPGGFDRISVGDAAISPAGRLVLAGAVSTAGSSASTAAVARLTLEPVADPVPAPAPPTPPGGVPGPVPGTGTLPSLDRTAPRLTGLKVAFDRKRVPTIRFTTDERARVTVLVERVRKGRKRGSTCVVGRKRGSRCTTFTQVKSVTATFEPGAVRSVKPTKGGLVRRAQYRVTLTASDTAGNRRKTSTTVTAPR